jgi:hypothetical protein
LSEKPKASGPEILQVLVGIARMQKGPEDLPASINLLVILLLASIVPDAVQLALAPMPFEGSVAALIALGIGATVFWYGMVLRVAGKPERLTQTLTAIFGIQLVLAPALVISYWFLATYSTDPTWRYPAAMLRMVVEVWALVVLARILRSATQWPMFACVMLAIAGELLTVLLALSLFPQPESVATPV